MLLKDVFIIYPPGYGGSYINWAINVSDLDNRSQTVLDPINKSFNEQFGGPGTSHLHVRLPTHQGLTQHNHWIQRNRPTDKRVYIINGLSEEIEGIVADLIINNPEAVFIHIHPNNNSVIESFGNINCITKWPTFLEAARRLVDDPDIDVYNCANNIKFRNVIVEDTGNIFPKMKKLDHTKIDSVIEDFKYWYKVRNSRQPHEVNETQYNTNLNYSGRLFELSCADLFNENFIDWFSHFMSSSGVSSNYDTNHVANFHPVYLSAQPNLQWFDSINKWKQTGKLDSYLLSHSMIQAQVIKLMFERTGIKFYTHNEIVAWNYTYLCNKGDYWPHYPPPNPNYFWYMPTVVINEYQNKIGYETGIIVPPKSLLDLDWRSKSLEEINVIYQAVNHQII